jgi:microcystin-dependent protein
MKNFYKHQLKKILLLVITLATFTLSGFSQVGFDNPNPDSSALIDMKAKDKGLLVPRMTSNDRTNMTLGGKSPANALLVFDLDQNMFFVYDTITNPDRWVALNPWYSLGSATDIITSTSGNVGIGTIAAPSAKLEVNGTIKSIGTITAPDYTLNISGNGPIPQGGIIMWSGNPSAIPMGWALCDGTSGRPDLRGRFIAGYDPTDADYNTVQKIGPSYTDADGYSSGNNTQDAKQIRLINNQSGLPAHNHGVNDPGHTHSYSDSYVPVSGTGYSGGGNRQIDWNTDLNRTTGNSTTGITIQNSVTQNAAQNFENRPPYYVLAYIIKL